MRNLKLIVISFLSLTALGLSFSPVFAVYRQSEHSPLQTGAVEVTGPGNYDKPGVTYMLTRNISSPGSAIFLGKDVVLDLNGFTITFADCGYTHVPNYDFEEGVGGWDLSRAPGARLESTDSVHIFIGKKILRLRAGDEIRSGYVQLPVAGRSYFAMCGVATREMRISLYVEDEKGNDVRCEELAVLPQLNRFEKGDLDSDFDYGPGTKVGCPVENRRVRLGGGFVTAHIHGLPAGKYRVRVKAETDCLVDHIDIRPAMDTGIGIVEKTYPWAHTDYLYTGRYCAFYDYTAQGSPSEPVSTIPRVTGTGTVTIKNGVIRSAAVGVLSWGIQSTAQGVKVVLENVRIVTQGINTNAVDVAYAGITNCRFEIDTPFIINRHVSEHAVVLRGLESSEVSSSEFIGGQGCMTVMGLKSLIHDNLFVNRQTVTNHYCVMARGDSSKIYNNRFEPEIGSGVKIFRHKYIEIFNNTFRIEASPPTCEYGHEEYSTTAIRIADYDAEAGSPRGCIGNRVYSNKFHIIGRDFPQYPDYVPMAWAFFHSASAGDTYYYDNEIIVEHRDPGSKALAAAAYIGGAQNGGEWYDNRITSNVYAFWIGTWYGQADNADIHNNTIIKAQDAPAGFKPVRIGFSGRPDSRAQNIRFRSNVVEGAPWGIDASDQDHSYKVYWTLSVKVLDKSSKPEARAEVLVMDSMGRKAVQGKTGGDGLFKAELPEYSVEGKKREIFSPYTVKVGKKKEKVALDRNLEVVLKKK